MAIDIQKVDEIVFGYEQSKESLLPILQDFQREFSYVPEEGIKRLSDIFGVPESRIYAMATFYKAFSLVPKGRHTIKVCMGTACHLKGAPFVVEAIERELKIKPGQTTEDRRFSLETVNCVGTCALAPVVVIDEDYYGGSTSENIIKNLKRYT
ncbi:MAG: NAD(P)H-dependent oxidoreductase subunit E [Deltaproteobacteria bacterium]|nr:NAD(P)H-dependent oxidoreductase subunit E [Deltaproteobacteria bacterium]